MSQSTVAINARHSDRVVSLHDIRTPARQSAGSPAGSPTSPSSGKGGPVEPDRGGLSPRSLPAVATGSAADSAESSYVDVLTDPVTGAEIGYRLIGRSAGPVVVVAGLCPSARRIFDRLMSIPTLPWMRGTLVMLHLDSVRSQDGLDDLSALGPIDRIIALPWSLHDQSEAWGVVRSYHAVLRACTDLGMISGRGVRLSWAQ